MYNGIGLQTARGSGTNGYVQTNKFFVRPKTGKVSENTRGFEAGQGTAGISKQPNKDVLEHDRKRRIQLKLVVLEDKLSDQGYTDAEIAQKLEEARRTLEAEAASRDDGGSNLDNKLSDTQTHQIAARKEKQMETLRSALGISTSEVDVPKGEGSDDDEDEKLRDRQISDSDDDDKPEHSFLDRDFWPKKRMVEDLKEGKDDKKKGAKESISKKNEGERESSDELRHHGKEARKERRRRDDSSDSDSSAENAKRAQKKINKRGTSDNSDSDIVDIRKEKKKISKKHKAYDSDDSDTESSDDDDDAGRRRSENEVGKYKKSHKRHDSDDSSDDDVGRKSSKKEVEKYKKLQKRHDSDESSDDDFGRKSPKKEVEKYNKPHKQHDSDDSSDDDDVGRKSSKKEVDKYKKRHRRHDSDDSSDDDDVGGKSSKEQVEKYKKSQKTFDSHDHDGGRSRSKKEVENYKKTHSRHESDDDSISEEDSYVKHGAQKRKQHARTSRRDDYDIESDDSGMEKKRIQLEKRRNGPGGSRMTQREIPSMDDRWNANNGIYENSESDSDKVRKHKREVRGRSGRRAETKGGDYDTSSDEKVEKHGRKPDSDEDSDSIYGRRSTKTNKGMEKVARRPESHKSSSGSDYEHVRAGRSKPKDKYKSELEDGEYSRGRLSGPVSVIEEKRYRSGAVDRDDPKRERSGATDNALDTLRKLENLYQSKGSMDRSGHDRKEMIRGKRKFDDENVDELPESRSRDRNFEQDTLHRGEYRKGSKTESELDARAYRNKDDKKRDEHSRLAGSGVRDEHVERGTRVADDEPQRGNRRDVDLQRKNREEDEPRRRSRREDEPQRGSRRDDEPQLKKRRDDYDYEERRGGRNNSRDEEEHRGSKHARDDEEDQHKRPTKDDEVQQHGSRRPREEEERGDRGYERDRQNDYKRARYDDHRPSERRRYDSDRRNDDRGRH